MNLTEAVGIALIVSSVVGALWVSWQAGTPKQYKKAETPNQLVDAVTAKDRVEQNRQIAMGRMSELEQRRAVAREKLWVRRAS